MSGNLTDKFLIASCLSGDEEAFGKLYDKYVDEILRFASMRLNRREEAEDVVSEVFLKAWLYISETDKHIDNFRALLYRITRNLVIDIYRKSGKELLAIDDAQLDTYSSTSEDLFGSVAHKDDMRIAYSLINTLPQDQSEIILMRYVHDLSIKEIAQATDKKPGTIRVTLHRAVKQIKEELKKIRP